jgi:uncharacterized protein YnzC (UPF0291/DUF896 family)
MWGQAMPETSTPITEAEILSQVVAPDRPGFAPELARAILELKFNQAALDRMRELAEKNNQGRLTEAESTEMEKYLRVGSFLDLIQAKSRLSLERVSG